MDSESSYNFVTENNIKVISAAAAMFYVCVATEIATISVLVAKILILPVLPFLFPVFTRRFCMKLDNVDAGGSRSGVP